MSSRDAKKLYLDRSKVRHTTAENGGFIAKLVMYRINN
jgi:hypothetical protein